MKAKSHKQTCVNVVLTDGDGHRFECSKIELIECLFPK